MSLHPTLRCRSRVGLHFLEFLEGSRPVLDVSVLCVSGHGALLPPTRVRVSGTPPAAADLAQTLWALISFSLGQHTGRGGCALQSVHFVRVVGVTGTKLFSCFLSASDCS